MVKNSKKHKKTSKQNRISAWLIQNPFKCFLGVLTLLILLIVLANFFRKPQTADLPSVKDGVKQVDVYDLSSKPEFSVLAKVKKGEIVDILSQSSGIVTSINKTDGKKVKKGEKLISVSNTYSGVNSAYIQSQIANKNNQLLTDNYDDQLRTINLQRSLSEKVDNQSDDLRKIAKDSLDGTKEVLSLNESLLMEVRTNISLLESQNNNGVNDQLLAQAKQSEAALVASINNIKSAIKQTEYQSADDSKPADIANQTRELSITQLDIQKRNLIIGRDISTLNLKLANVALQMSTPVSPCKGEINSFDVTKYDVISPGSKIATIVCDQTSTQLTSYISPDIAAVIDTNSEAYINIDNKNEEITISYISNEIVNGSQHKVIFELPQHLQSRFSDNSYVKIKIAGNKYVQNFSYIPVDSIYQTGDTSSVMFLISDGNISKAESKNIEILSLIDKYAIVNLKYEQNNQIILTRGIKNQEKVNPR